jgi:LysR family transcriptional regulator, transcription activator of glutamate synthase operon
MEPSVDSRQLRYFLALVTFANFRVAAKNSGISQPGLSRQIMSLEAELGGPLFNRNSRKITLTPIGECFLPYARRAVRELEQSQQAIKELLRPDKGEICVAALHSVNTYLLPSLLAQFREQYPQIQLRLSSLGSERITKVLLDRLVDLAIVMGPATAPELLSIPLYEEELVFLVPAKHPLTRLETVRLVDIAPYPQIVFRDGYAMNTTLNQIFAEIDCVVDVAVELNTLEAFKETVRQGVGVALLPITAVQNLPPDLASLRVQDPKLTRKVELICHRDNYQIPVVAAFADLVAKRLPFIFNQCLQNSVERSSFGENVIPLKLVAQ